MLDVNKPCLSTYHLVFVIQGLLTFVNFKALLEKEIILFLFSLICSAQNYMQIQTHDGLQQIKSQ